MSTWLFLECREHDPPLRAELESGQHTYDLPRIRAEIADRDAVITWWIHVRLQRPVGGAGSADEYFRAHSAVFLLQHPRCRIGIRDEYGREHPVEDECIPELDEEDA